MGGMGEFLYKMHLNVEVRWGEHSIAPAPWTHFWLSREIGGVSGGTKMANVEQLPLIFKIAVRNPLQLNLWLYSRWCCNNSRVTCTGSIHLKKDKDFNVWILQGPTYPQIHCAPVLNNNTGFKKIQVFGFGRPGGNPKQKSTIVQTIIFQFRPCVPWLTILTSTIWWCPQRT